MEDMDDRATSTKTIMDYGFVYISEILSIIARQSTGRPGMEEIIGQTIDILERLDFSFYDLVWFWNEQKMDMTEDQRLLGHWLGIAHRMGSYLTYWILTQNGRVIARSTVQHVTTTDLQQPTIQTKVKEFEEAVKVRLFLKGPAIVIAMAKFATYVALWLRRWLFVTLDYFYLCRIPVVLYVPTVSGLWLGVQRR
jgi:hypothetical protein